MLRFARKKITNDAAALVAILMVNDRAGEAAEVAAATRQAWDDKSFQAAIDEALTGKVPEPWP